jgi:hypothetical protein
MMRDGKEDSMSHVDEGALHAYLDGELPPAERAGLEAHLAQCSACKTLLTEERALLERASALLGSARPTERPVPPFEQVRRTPKQSRWRIRTPLAWAASIMLALGLGYFLRGAGSKNPATLSLETREQPAAVAPESSVAFQSAREEREAAPERVYRRQTAQAPAVGADKREADAAALFDTIGRRDSTVPGVVAMQPRVQLRSPNPQSAQREADSLAPLRASGRAQDEAVVAGAAAAPAQQSKARDDAARLSSRSDPRSVRNLLSTTWPLISRGKAASLLGDRPVGVPGLATRRIRGSPGTDSTVVVEQALDSNTVIQIFQRSATAASNNESLERERAVLARYVGRLRVEITGPVSTDSLNKLLEQVEPLP